MAGLVTDMRPICEAESDNGGAGWVRTFTCSLDEGHDGPHRAYWNHEVTGNGRDVCWLGPWIDETPWEDEESERLYEEWINRHEENRNSNL